MSNHNYDQLLHDIFVTACEGGVNYWAMLGEYRWSTDGGVTEDLEGFRATVYDNESDEADRPAYVLDRTAMDRGYRLACGEWREKFVWQCDPDLPQPDDVTEDGWDHDAFDADAIVQLGLLGDVVYG